MVEVNDGEPAPVAETSEEELDKFEEPILRSHWREVREYFALPQRQQNPGFLSLLHFFPLRLSYFASSSSSSAF